MADLPNKPEIDSEQGGLFGWKADLFVDAVSQLSVIAGLAVLTGFIVKAIIGKNSGALPGRKVV